MCHPSLIQVNGTWILGKETKCFVQYVSQSFTALDITQKMKNYYAEIV